MRNIKLFAPEAFPTVHSEVRAYTMVAFRVTKLMINSH